MSGIESLWKDYIPFILGFMSSMLGLIISTYVLTRTRSQETGYNRERHEAQLSSIRASYEDKISDLNERLVATEKRWIEMNHLVLDSQEVQDDDPVVSVESFLTQFGIDKNEPIDPRLALVLTPFNERERPAYEAIARACQKMGFRCVRGDEEYTKTAILPHVVSLMVRSRIIIANIGTRNANVYYELGIAHALSKPTMLVSKTLKSIPFDVKQKRIVTYETLDELESRVMNNIGLLLADHTD